MEFKSWFGKFVSKPEVENETEIELQVLSYSSVPLTLALRKRKYEEEQFERYGVQKNKTFDWKS